MTNYRNPAQKASANKSPSLPWPLEGKGAQIVVARWRYQPAGHEHGAWVIYQVNVRVRDREMGGVGFQVNRLMRSVGDTCQRLVGYVPVSENLMVDLDAATPPLELLRAFRRVVRLVQEQAAQDEALLVSADERVESW